MKKAFVLFAALALGSCNGPNFTLTGSVALPAGDSVYLVGGDRISGFAAVAGADRTRLAAGVVAHDSTICLRGRVAGPGLARLTDRDGVTAGPALFFLERGTIRLEFSDELQRITATGTPLNDLKGAFDEQMAAFERQFRELPFGAAADSLMAAYDKLVPETVAANRDNLFGVWLYATHQFKHSDLADIAGVKDRLAQFPARMRAHPLLKGIAQRVAAIENTQTGKPFIDLVLPDTADRQVALSALAGSGRWTLVEFWASWCAPCRAEIPCLRAAYAAYRDKGFGIYAVSLDNDSAKWKAFIRENDLPWVNVSGVGADKRSDAATRYGIVSIPTNFLISPEGVIAARNLRGEKLKAKLAEVLP